MEQAKDTDLAGPGPGPGPGPARGTARGTARRRTARGTARRRNPRGQGSRLREEFVDAAARLIADSGREDAVTVRAVTRAVGSAPQSFYLHFPTVDALLWELYAREFASLTARLTEAAASSAGPRHRLEAVCRAYCAFAAEQPSAYRLMFSVTGRTDLDWGGQLPGIAAFRVLEDAVRACQPDRDPGQVTETASLLWAALHGLAGLRHDRPAFGWAPLDTQLATLTAALVP